MNILETILENNPDDTFLKADGFDEAVIGYDDLLDTSEEYRELDFND